MPLINLVAALAMGTQFSPDAVLLRTPDVSETHLVFQYGGDLWTSLREGGPATRLTSAEGTESMPKFSPDGQTVAFMADYDGGTDIYTVPLAGGPPRRLTFHPHRETLANWHPSGDSLLFFSSEASGIYGAHKIFRVPIDGGSPVPLPIPYGTYCDIDPSGQWLAYTPLTREHRTWRRYRGGMAQDIWLFHLETGESRRVTDDPGTDRMPMWSGSKLLFQSDRGEKGIANLYEYDPATGATERLTSFAASGAKYPSIGPKDVVFEQGGSLFRYLLDSQEIERVRVSIPGDRPSLRPIARDLSKSISSFSLSRTGRRVAIEARGEIFSVPAGEGLTRNLTLSDGVAERSPSFSPDGRWIAYWSDRSGEYELTLKRADGAPFEGADAAGERRLTQTGRHWKEDPSWSPDSKRIAWSNEKGEAWVLDVEGGLGAPPVLVAVGYAPTGLKTSWSPDSAWLTWSTKSTKSNLEAIFLYDVEKGATHEVTSGLFNDQDPTFSTCGQWLFFQSARAFSPTYADLDSTWIYEQTACLMAVPLNSDVELPWAPVNLEEDVQMDGTASQDEAATEAADEDDSQDLITLEIDGFESRVVQLEVEPGLAGGLIGHDNSIFFARTDDDMASIYRLSLEDLKEGPKLVLKDVDSYELSKDGKKLLVLSGEKLGVIDAAPGQTLEEPLNLTGVRGRFDPRAEWPQMINDVYRLYRDYFYDENLHGVDWVAERDKALDRLADCTSRADVHFLIGEMIAELNVGHAYNGAPEHHAPADGFSRTKNLMRTGLLGADWTPLPTAGAGAGFKVQRVLGSGAETDGRGPLHGQAVAGDVLVAVNGVKVDATKSIHEHLVGTAGRTIELEFLRADRDAGEGGTEKVLVKPIRSETDLRYRDWVAQKRAAVHRATDGAVGYIHVPDTEYEGQSELYRQFMAEHHRKALIIDERWNAGGQIPHRFIELLARKPMNAWATSGEKFYKTPQVHHEGPKAMLINHSAGSGGDAFPWYFRKSGLGPLIGTRTWGGLVGLSGNPGLIDGATPSVPNFGFFKENGTWAVEGHGVEPDIEVLDDPGQMRGGEDPQLERAITELRAAMETWQYVDWKRPASPVRRGAGIQEANR